MKRLLFVLLALLLSAPLMAAAYFFVSPYHIQLRETVADPNARQAGILKSLDFERTRLSAYQGNREAQYRLGRHFAAGSLGFRNAPEAARWFARAAKQGHARAQLHLAAFSLAGDGVPKSETAAVEWLRLAAKDGAAEARDLLGVLYLGGIGTGQDIQAGIDTLRQSGSGESAALAAETEQRLAAVYALPREERDAALDALGKSLMPEMRTRLQQAVDALNRMLAAPEK